MTWGLTRWLDTLGEPERVILLRAAEDRCYMGDPWMVLHMHLDGRLVEGVSHGALWLVSRPGVHGQV